MLNRREKLQFIGDLVRTQVADQFERLAPAARIQQRYGHVNLDAVVVPDSDIALAAREHAQNVCTPAVYLHCIRTFFWGAMLAQGQRLSVDPELLWVSSLLHDVGISPGYIEGARETCFSVIGAREASAFVSDRGFDAARSRQVYEAVSFHFNPIVDHKRAGAEARFVAEGASLDVLGVRSRRVPLASTLELLRRYPRNGFSSEIVVTNTVAHPPDSRPGFLGSSGFERVVRRNPLDRVLTLAS